MSFFAHRPGTGPPEPEEVEPAQPEWVAPPLGVLPGLSTQRAMPFRTGEAAMLVHNFKAYPTGVAFEVDVFLRMGGIAGIPLMVHHPRYREGDQFTDDLIRFGLQLSDGSSWSNLDMEPPIGWPPSTNEPPPSPVVSCNGGSGGGHTVSASYWLWPLPPEGPLTFFAEWPAHNIPESSAIIDATGLRNAATRSEPLW